MNSLPDHRDNLPGSIEEIGEAIGMRLALKIVAVFGGREIKFPGNPSDNHPVIVALGKEDGYKVCNYMAGGTLSVPHCRPRRNAKAEIQRLEAEGLTRGEIARRLGITQRWVRKMANDPPPDHPDLFSD
ncbi:helix-turn-helix domain-containing protein [Martelella mediterranea]|uniref:Homeodomain-like domain-containing protein n=1 Tax=Martelella mediterranea TaxID=293089 RepID=A0A4R3NUY3_9HYPH|nr:helix-turn-helix domain-containing protein [Martelella mediterranea]TCT37445.1 hypothetical protein EDC90_101822 [Martelella mediterranea]